MSISQYLKSKESSINHFSRKPFVRTSLQLPSFQVLLKWSTLNVHQVCRTLELPHDKLNTWDTQPPKLDGSFGYEYYGLVPRLTTQSPSVLHHLNRVIRVWKCQTLVRDRSKTVRNINGWRYCFLGIKAFRFCF